MGVSLSLRAKLLLIFVTEYFLVVLSSEKAIRGCYGFQKPEIAFAAFRVCY